MGTDSFKIFNLERHETKDIVDNHVNGELTVIWRDWDNHDLKLPKMIYITSVRPNEKKGPHLHTKRNSYFTCIQGEVIFIIKDKTGTYHEIEMSDINPQLIFIPKNIPASHINVGTKPAKILAITDISWKPDSNEMKNVQFDDYDWEKWNIEN